MKRILMTLAYICNALAWWFAEKAGEVHTQIEESGLITKSWTHM